METIIIHPSNQEQQQTVQAFLDALQIPYEKKTADETGQILSNSYLSDKLNKSIQEEKEGKVNKVDVNNLWK